MRVSGTYRLFPAGTAVSGATVALYDADDLVTVLTSTTTAADGTWTIARNFSPGKWKIKITDSVNGVTRWLSSTDSVMMGANSSYDFNYVLASLGDGVLDNVGNEFETTASSLTSTVQTGAALVKGIIVDTASNTALVHDAHDANPRKDRIVLRVTRLGQTDEGKSEALIIKGTAAASPSLPALTQSSTTWDYELYEVLVPATSGALTLTDRRTFVGTNSLAKPAPTITSSSSTSTVSSFGTSMASIYSFSVASYNHVSDGFLEAYVNVSVTSGTLTLAAYCDVVGTTGPSVQITGPRTVCVPLRIACGPGTSDSSRTLGIAASLTTSGVASVTGYQAYYEQFRRV